MDPDQRHPPSDHPTETHNQNPELMAAEGEPVLACYNVPHSAGDRNNQHVSHKQERNADRIHRDECTVSPRPSTECVFRRTALAG